MSNNDNIKAKKSSRSSGYRLKQARGHKALTQSEVAERLGTTQINVSRWENGITLPSPFYRQKLTDLFGQSLEELGLIPDDNEQLESKAFSDPNTSDLQGSPAPPGIWSVPFRRNTFFTGREDIIDRLSTIFRNNPNELTTNIQAISGLGGIGKTQIAIEYAYRYSNRYDHVFWINATTSDTLSSDFVMLAALLDLPEQHEQDQDTVVRAVKRWLTNHSNWLLILDDVKHAETILGYLPMRISGNVLITTRQQASGAIVQTIEIDKMLQAEGVRFILSRSKVVSPDIALPPNFEEQQALAADIYSALDGLPLALDQAGAYIEETRCGLSQYLKLYSTRRKELLSRRGRLPINHPDSVAASWSLSFQQVKSESPAAVDLLKLLAFFNPDSIPEDLIIQGAAALSAPLRAVVNDPFEFNRILELLLKYSLIHRNAEAKSLSIHHLVQAVLKDEMNEESKSFWAERAIRTANCAFPDVDIDQITLDYDLQHKCQRYIAHVLTLSKYIDTYALAFPEAGRLFHEAATYLTHHARYNPSEQLLLKALDVRQKISGDASPGTARTLHNLGTLYIDQGRYLEAEPLLEKALAIRQKDFGEEHAEVAQTRNSLANSYRKQGKYNKAEPLYLRALRTREAILGPTSDQVAESYYGLIKLYNTKEEYSKALEYCQKALTIQEHNLGENHPRVASTLNMLAKIYLGQSKFEQAEEINKRALNIRESNSGPDHPHVSVILNSLAETYHARSMYVEARPLIDRALEIQKQSLGPEHPYVAYSLSNLAKNLLIQKDYVQAEIYYKQAISIREQHLGVDHPLTASTCDALAELYTLKGEDEKSELLYRQALTIRERTFGPEHPTVTRTLKQLASILKKQHKENEAAELEKNCKATTIDPLL